MQVTEQEYATKTDLAGVEDRLSGRIDRVEIRLKADISGVEERLNGRIDRVEVRLNSRIGEVHEDLREFRMEMRGELREVRTEAREDFKSLAASVERLRGDGLKLALAIGALIATVAAFD